MLVAYSSWVFSVLMPFCLSLIILDGLRCRTEWRTYSWVGDPKGFGLLARTGEKTVGLSPMKNFFAAIWPELPK